METEDMIKRLDAGEKAINLTIEKWEDMLVGTGIDDGESNCACCYVDGDGNCSTCSIREYEDKQVDLHSSGKDYDNAFQCNLCGHLPSEKDKEGLEKVIEYLERVKKWMIERGEYE